MGIFNKNEEETTYEMDYLCDNCDDNETHTIERGTTVLVYLQSTICSNCGCKLWQEKKLEEKQYD